MNIPEEKVLEQVNQFRDMWSLKEEPIQDIFLEAVNRNFIVIEFPSNFQISGFFVEKKDRDKMFNCIYINSLEPVGRKNFSLAHELYHCYFYKSNDTICGSKNRKDPIEKAAELFASNLLIPRKHLYSLLKKNSIKNTMQVNTKFIFALQKIYKVSFQAVLYTLKQMKDNPDYEDAIPSNINSAIFTKYYNHKYFEELTSLTLSDDKLNNLNSVIPRFKLPDRYKDILVQNYNGNKISNDELKEIFDFFEESI